MLSYIFFKVRVRVVTCASHSLADSPTHLVINSEPLSFLTSFHSPCLPLSLPLPLPYVAFPLPPPFPSVSDPSLHPPLPLQILAYMERVFFYNLHVIMEAKYEEIGRRGLLDSGRVKAARITKEVVEDLDLGEADLGGSADSDDGKRCPLIGRFLFLSSLNPALSLAPFHS